MPKIAGEHARQKTTNTQTTDGEYQETLDFLREENRKKTEYVSLNSIGGWLESDRD